MDWGTTAQRAGAVVATLAMVFATVGVAVATADEIIIVTPEADTWVSADSPDVANGGDALLFADGNGPRTAYLRFSVVVPDGHNVVDATLVLTATDSAPDGVGISLVNDVAWEEATTTFTSRPAVDGPQVGTLPATAAGQTVSVDLTAGITGSGTYSFALQNHDVDDATFASRESDHPPTLHVTVGDGSVAMAAAVETDSVTQVLTSVEGSSNPTSQARNRRLAVTAGDRRLLITGRHGEGVGVSWRELDSATWQRTSTGASTQGILIAGTNTGDWSASIAVGPDAAGVEHAWVVMARDGFSNAGYGLYLVRLDDLDAVGGPTIGPLTTLDLPDRSAKMADIAMDLSDPTTPRVAVVYTARTTGGNDTVKRVIVGWLSDLASPTPVLVDTAILVEGDASRRHGALVPSATGMRVLVRDGGADTVLWSHAAGSPPNQWSAGPRVLDNAEKPENAVNGVALDDGTLVVTGQADQAVDTVDLVTVGADGQTVTPIAELLGYTHPIVTGDGLQVWLVMVRSTDGAVVSRRWDPTNGLSAADVVEMTAGDTFGRADWPSVARHVDGTLLIATRGQGNVANPSKFAVISSARQV